MGNPYSSSIDPNAMALGGTEGSIYIWDGDDPNGNIGLSYAWMPWASGVPANYMIAPTQGFFIAATVDGTPFNVPAAARVHGGTFYKDEVANLLVLDVNNGVSGDKVYVRFLDEATSGQDLVWDAPKLMSGVPEIPNMYTTSGNLKFAIDARPATSMVPMSFECGVNGTFTIQAIETSDFANVVLEDLANGIQTDLLNSSYSFDYTTGAVHNFIIHFTPLGTIDNLADNITISAENHNIYVNVPGSVRGDIAVYNMMGQEVVRVDMNQGLNTIPMHDVNTYYIVKVISDAAAKTGKVFIR
jgi:hypothetical protein